MADYLPNVNFNRRGNVASVHKTSTWFDWDVVARNLNDNELTMNQNLDAKTVLRDSFTKYIINTPMQNTTLGIEILYTDRPDQVSPKRIFIVRRVRPGQPERQFKIVSGEIELEGWAPTDRRFDEIGTVFRNNQLREVVKKLRRKNILQISLCEVYNDGVRNRNGREYRPYTMEVGVLYRNISRDMLNRRLDAIQLRREANELLARQRRLQQGRGLFMPQRPVYNDVPLNNRNPNQLQVVPAPDPVPPITSSSYSSDGSEDGCPICMAPVVGQGCRVNCRYQHIFHCDCIDEWRNTSYATPNGDRGWHNNCVKCNLPISQMYHVDIPEGFTTTTEFGKRSKRSKRRNTTNSGMSLKTIDSLIKYVQKL